MGERLAGRVALVTGGGSGIGRATVLRFVAEGAAVAVLDVRGEAAAETVALVPDGSALALTADVTVAAEVDAAVDAAAARFGRLDVLVNNAGTFGVLGSVEVIDEADWDRCMAVNVKGVQLCSRAALRHFAPAPGESAGIVNVASVAGLVGIGWASVYCASKGAVVALTRQMALDLGPRQVRVNAVCPGTVLTPMSEPLLAVRGGGDLAAGIAMTVEKYPIGRLGTPAEIAAAVLFLASEEASFLTGSIVAADGGMTAG
ncbi:SDR family NAD(P)-dependent oxidoreductase [Sporichthya sp.]|uniref:SDR family NAD(P)-dependent oxidoreductase n=1 Tax=Sporichthya sp. TaxID=65475 RepID=UPI00183A538B|nr:SDR family oxidoreductase [Sporichthya sp.]MBA3745082.1 SDR family oxidoreductase [Sporichthya sp.]